MPSSAESLPVYIGLGSNLDNPASQIKRAIERLCQLPDTRVTAQSSLYRSAPFGPVEQPDFVNAVVALATRLAAVILLQRLQNIECLQGRVRGNVRWGPRTLDLDLLVYSDQVIETPDLTVPHPGIGERNFVLLPLREIAPDLMIPGLGRLSEISIPGNDSDISRIE